VEIIYRNGLLILGGRGGGCAEWCGRPAGVGKIGGNKYFKFKKIIFCAQKNLNYANSITYLFFKSEFLLGMTIVFTHPKREQNVATPMLLLVEQSPIHRSCSFSKIDCGGKACPCVRRGLMGRVRVQIHTFLTSSLGECEWSKSHAGRLDPGDSAPSIFWTGGCVGLSDGLDTLNKSKIGRSPEVQPVAKIWQYNKILIPAVLNSPIRFREKLYSS